MRPKLSSRPRNSMTAKMPGEATDPVKAARNGWATAPSVTPFASAKERTRSFQRVRSPLCAAKSREERRQLPTGLRCQQPRGLVVRMNRPLRDQKAGIGRQLGQGLRAQLQLGHRAQQAVAVGFDKWMVEGVLQPLGHQGDEARIIGGRGCSARSGCRAWRNQSAPGRGRRRRGRTIGSLVRSR